MKQPPSQHEIAVLFDRALSSHQRGNLQVALDCYQQILAAQPRHVDAMHNLGVLYGQLGRFDEALSWLGEAGAAQPGNFLVHYHKGRVFQALTRFDEALAAYDQAVELKPDCVEAYIYRGSVLNALRRYEEALSAYDKAVVLMPDHAGTYLERSGVLENLDRYDAALADCDKAIALQPDYAEAHNNRGTLLEAMELREEALAAYERAIALQPNRVEFHINRAHVLKDLEHFDDAVAAYDKAIALKPDFAEVYNERGNILSELYRYEDAVDAYRRSIALQPDNAVAFCNLANVLKNLKRYDEAMVCYDKAIALWPDYADAFLYKSLLLLLLGAYEEGWKLFEWRRKFDEMNGSARVFDQPLWLGDEPPAGKVVLLHAEQGYGDAIQFVRYVPMVEALGARVILEVPAVLVPLTNTLRGAFTTVARGKKLPAFDLHCPLMSLPLAFRTTVDTIPASVPYLDSIPGRRGQWSERLGDKARPRVGLAWSGHMANPKDRARSIPLRDFSALLELDVEFHSLQKEVRTKDAAALAGFTQIRSHGSALRDFADTAALVAEMDLVVTADTSVAHLAGALGKPVWILLPFVPDFRWLTERNDSPWYPTARLFRQSASGDWRGVIAEVREQLQGAGLS